MGHHHHPGAPVHGVRLGGGAGPLGIPHPYHHHHGSNLLHLLDKLPRELRELNIESTNPTQTPVIIVYNLPANITVHMLFNLFSLYGSVLRVKILREKSDTALIQYSDPLYATIALNYIQGANVLGQSLQVGFSKNMEVKLPPPNSNKTEANAEEEKRTVAFSIKDQRYGGDDVEKYVKGSCRPTKTIFVANLDESATDEEVQKLFKEHGQVSKFTFKAPKNESAKTQMAMMEMGTEAEAVAAVMYLHNHELHGRSMKVAFSKTVL
ncbi:RNA recognition motif-containing protein [Besnoitia besnoiti]|uniref:RNA recognition motif-containing protein n=1 Tax=Besnoitia besnoiti TaxID=94643 RepID=A0A2A9M221_BESBE|nr:RNA recognition motif-containing protein [Besnoitia besnoiti]PFH32035.1 RNA recognition motif-containing protein [Besnoitia besnoiti]